jgi:hypothetical protein
MKKGIIQALAIPIIFTIVVISVLFISIKYNIVKAVDIEFSVDNSQSVLQTFLTSTTFDADSNREQSLMELIGESQKGIQLSIHEEVASNIYRSRIKCEASGTNCVINDLLWLMEQRFSSLVYTTCYRIWIGDYDPVGSNSKSEEAKERTGKDHCDLAYPSSTIIPLPYNKEKLSEQVRLLIE